VRQAIETGDASNARKLYQSAVPIIDRMATKRIIHKNTAARYKSQLNTRIKNLATKSAA
jgi:small subunit ribosomal protein S20